MRSDTVLMRMMLPAIVVVLALAGPASSVQAQDPEPGSAERVVEPGAAAAESEVVFYYFHGNRRCNTCRKIESYAQQAVEARFDNELQAGTLQWRVVNTDEPANAHYVKDFGLVSSSLVVVEMNGDEVVRHDVLHDAWTLVRDEARFVQYVQRSVHRYLK